MKRIHGQEPPADRKPAIPVQPPITYANGSPIEAMQARIIRLQYDDGAPYHFYARSLVSFGYEILSHDHQFQTTALSESTAIEMILSLERAYQQGRRAGVCEMKEVLRG